MNSENKNSRVLGFAFLFQFITSISSGIFFSKALIVPGDISETMTRIANNPAFMRTNILVDMATAIGIVFLGAMLYIALKNQNEKIALTAFGLYIVEAALLAVSRTNAFSLLTLSKEYISAGQSGNLLFAGKLALESMDFGGVTLHMLTFCIGGILFYYLLFKSRLVPRILSLWGLITVIPCLVATLFVFFGFNVPFIIYVPYVPFELAIGIWILIRGIYE